MSDLLERPVIANSFSFTSYIGYNPDLAQLYFDDFQKEIENHSLWLEEYLVIFENETVKNAPHYKISELRKMKKDELADLVDLYYCADMIHTRGISHGTKPELIDDLMTITNEDYYKLHHSEIKWQYLESDFTIRGYSQGEVYKVKLVGNVDKYITSDYLTCIFYDTPVDGYIKVTMGDSIEELDYYGILPTTNEYEWDKHKFLVALDSHTKNKPYHEQLMAWANQELEEYLDYI